MKITFFTDTFLPKIDGVSISLVTIASALASEGHKIQIFAPRPKNMREINWKVENIALVMLRSIPTLLYPEFRAATPVSPRLVMYLRRFKPDIIHFQSTFLIGAGGVILGKLIKKPIIGSFHTNFMHEEYLRHMRMNYQPEIFSAILWKYALLFFNQCDAVLTPSQETGRELKRQGVRRPIFVIPNSIDEKKTNRASNGDLLKLRERFHLKEKVLLYVGRVSVEKSLDLLLKAFAELLKKRQDVTLLVIGHGPKLKDLQKLANELGIDMDTVFTGKIVPERLLTEGYYQLADAFVTPSTSEVQPVSIIEAMYFGLPIIGIAKRGVGEMVKGVGLLSPVNDTNKFVANINHVLTDDMLREKLSKNSLNAYGKKYKVDIVLKQYEKLYMDVIANYRKKKTGKDINLSRMFLDE